MPSCTVITAIFIAILSAWLGYHEMRLRKEHTNGDACKQLKLGQDDPYWTRELLKSEAELDMVLDDFMDARAAGNLVCLLLSFTHLTLYTKIRMTQMHKECTNESNTQLRMV